MPYLFPLLLLIAQDQATFQRDVALVHVDAEVRENGRAIAGLGKESFRVTDDGRPQAIVYFGYQEEPLDLILLFDGRDEVRPDIRRVAKAAHTALSDLRHADRVAIMVFGVTAAEEAARELGVDLIWDGPTSLDAAKQNAIVESWITGQVDVIAVAVENQAGISTVLRKAREHGIRVLTWDADAAPEASDFFVNQATAQAVGETLTDEAARLLHRSGEFAIVTGALTAANQNEWIKFIRQRLAEKYPNLKLAVVGPSDDDRDKAFAETQTIRARRKPYDKREAMP